PLNDDDRWPWLATVRATLVDACCSSNGGTVDIPPSSPPLPRAVVACSALRRAYRDVLRGIRATTTAASPPPPPPPQPHPPLVRFVYLRVPPPLLRARLEARQAHHFMGPAMLASQLATLEEPVPATVGGGDGSGGGPPEEGDVVVVDVREDCGVEDIAAAAWSALGYPPA
ncbi:hypothetical protein HK405_011176, partial [Cladochytrium tenue]